MISVSEEKQQELKELIKKLDEEKTKFSLEILKENYNKIFLEAKNLFKSEKALQETEKLNLLEEIDIQVNIFNKIDKLKSLIGSPRSFRSDEVNRSFDEEQQRINDGDFDPFSVLPE